MLRYFGVGLLALMLVIAMSVAMSAYAAIYGNADQRGAAVHVLDTVVAPVNTLFGKVSEQLSAMR